MTDQLPGLEVGFIAPSTGSTNVLFVDRKVLPADTDSQSFPIPLTARRLEFWFRFENFSPSGIFFPPLITIVGDTTGNEYYRSPPNLFTDGYTRAVVHDFWFAKPEIDQTYSFRITCSGSMGKQWSATVFAVPDSPQVQVQQAGPQGAFVPLYVDTLPSSSLDATVVDTPRALHKVSTLVAGTGSATLIAAPGALFRIVLYGGYIETYNAACVEFALCENAAAVGNVLASSHGVVGGMQPLVLQAPYGLAANVPLITVANAVTNAYAVVYYSIQNTVTGAFS